MKVKFLNMSGGNMNFYKLAAITLLLVAIVFGCSKKKEEAAKLQEEMMGQEEMTADSMADSNTFVEEDTLAEIADASAVPEEEPRYMPKQPSGDGYTVQVAGCEDRTYAEHLVDKYLERGYEPYMTTITIEGQTYYRVRIGSFTTMSEAKALKAELADKYSLDVWIDEITPSF